jgi:phosphatidylserine/phosphatidylglycerophosphate/cardiolipin synthase-like enzyme
MSFAPPRENNNARWFVNGCEYFEALCHTLKRARKCIYIADWCFSPSLYLQRTPITETSRLDKILLQKAKEGVKIYLLIYNAPAISFALQPQWVVETMESLHRKSQYNLHLPPSFSISSTSLYPLPISTLIKVLPVLVSRFVSSL